MGNEVSNENFPHGDSKMNTTTVFRRIKNIEEFEMKPNRKDVNLFIETLKRKNFKLQFVPNFPWLLFLFPKEENKLYALLVLPKGVDVGKKTENLLLQHFDWKKCSSNSLQKCSERLLRVFPHILKENKIENCFKLQLNIL